MFAEESIYVSDFLLTLTTDKREECIKEKYCLGEGLLSTNTNGNYSAALWYSNSYDLFLFSSIV